MQAASGWQERANVEDASDEHSSYESVPVPATPTATLPTQRGCADRQTCDSSTSSSGCANWALEVLLAPDTSSVLVERLAATASVAEAEAKEAEAAAGAAHTSGLRTAHKYTMKRLRRRRRRTADGCGRRSEVKTKYPECSDSTRTDQLECTMYSCLCALFRECLCSAAESRQRVINTARDVQRCSLFANSAPSGSRAAHTYVFCENRIIWRCVYLFMLWSTTT